MIYGYSIRASKMPEPDRRVIGENGDFWPVMLHYRREGESMTEAANDYGFDLKTVFMDEDLPDDDVRVQKYLENGDARTAMDLWRPVVKGWKLSGMWDTEDGPVAIFLRKREPNPNPEPSDDAP